MFIVLATVNHGCYYIIFMRYCLSIISSQARHKQNTTQDNDNKTYEAQTGTTVGGNFIKSQLDWLLSTYILPLQNEQHSIRY